MLSLGMRVGLELHEAEVCGVAPGRAALHNLSTLYVSKSPAPSSCHTYNLFANRPEQNPSGATGELRFN